jgi:maltooligosyltrehalose trehalohydrolase
MKDVRKLPVGAEVMAGGGVNFRVWAPIRRKVELLLEQQEVRLVPEENGYYSAFVRDAKPGMLYRFRLDGDGAFPDPASRYQPQGPHGPSEIIEPVVFRWSDQSWQGLPLQGQVLYEMHIGTFTQEGTWQAAVRELPELARIGITVLEVMPVAEFPGKFGWGYDGVGLFAPAHIYGTPDDFKTFVNVSHELGMAVILDVVYNHLGPDGNYLGQFSPYYFTPKHTTDWGPPINFDGEHSGPVREYYLANAHYWVEEYHLDGLRLDATQDIHDDSDDHILTAINRTVRQAAGGRETILVAENEPQDARLVMPPERDGYGLDGLWNDDFHHSAMVALTAHNDAYYTDYRGTPQEFISAMKYGYLYQGQWYEWQKKRRGIASLSVPQFAFITFIQNHDQVANSGRGERAHQISAPGLYRALTALMLLGPGTPMLFQGQEFAASSPFLFFADHHRELSSLIHNGRKEFLRQWRSLGQPEMQKLVRDPADPRTFALSKLDHSERQKHEPFYALHCDLLALRRADPVLQNAGQGKLDGAVLSSQAFLLRFFDEQGRDRLMVVNLGVDLHLRPAPEPLLAPPEGMRWETLFSTEDPKYGGYGTAPLDTEENWRIPGHAAIMLRPVAAEEKNG